MSNVYSKDSSNVISSETINELFNLANQLELKNPITSQPVKQYFDYKRVFPEINPEIAEKISNANSNVKFSPQLIDKLNNCENKFEQFIVYNLKQSVKLDHESGRPSIYLGIDEQTSEHKFLCGTSKKDDNKNEVLELDLSKIKKTYFYKENIRLINDSNSKEIVTDFWARDSKTNKPIDFLNLQPEKFEQLKQNIGLLKDHKEKALFITEEKLKDFFDIKLTKTDGTCFFDAIAQGLKAKNINSNSSELVKISQNYFQEHLQKDDSWLKKELTSSLPVDTDISKYMKEFIDTGKETIVTHDKKEISRSRWGQVEIDGKIFCEHFSKNSSKWFTTSTFS